MNVQDQIALVQRAYSDFKKRDLESLMLLMTDDISWELPKIENVPFSGKRQGKAQVREFFQTLATVQDVISFNPMEFVAQNDKVIALGNYQWRAKETGRQFGGDWAHVFGIRDGKISSFHEYMDTAQAAAAFAREAVVH